MNEDYFELEDIPEMPEEKNMQKAKQSILDNSDQEQKEKESKEITLKTSSLFIIQINLYSTLLFFLSILFTLLLFLLL